MEFCQILASCKSSSSKNDKIYKDFINKIGFKDIKSPVKVRNRHRIEKKDSIDISVFNSMFLSCHVRVSE